MLPLRHVTTLSAISNASGPLTLITEMAPVPGTVAGAQIVSSFLMYMISKKYLCKNRNLIAEKRRKILIFAKICRARKRATLTKCKQKEPCVIDQHPLHI